MRSFTLISPCSLSLLIRPPHFAGARCHNLLDPYDAIWHRARLSLLLASHRRTFVPGRRRSLYNHTATVLSTVHLSHPYQPPIGWFWRLSKCSLFDPDGSSPAKATARLDEARRTREREWINDRGCPWLASTGYHQLGRDTVKLGDISDFTNPAHISSNGMAALLRPHQRMGCAATARQPNTGR